MKLPVISKDTANSVSQKIDVYLQDPKTAFKDVVEELYRDNRELLKIMATYAKSISRDKEERRAVISSFLLAYKLMSSQVESDELKAMFDLENTCDEKSYSEKPSLPEMET